MTYVLVYLSDLLPEYWAIHSIEIVQIFKKFADQLRFLLWFSFNMSDFIFSISSGLGHLYAY